MKFYKIIPLISLFLLTGCQVSYLLKSSYNQISIWTSEESIEKSLGREELTQDQKNKILLAQEAKKFAEEDLGLKKSGSYKKFVLLNRDYVTYVVNAAPRWEFKSFEWSYPIVGKMPYKGFFSDEEAKQEELELQKQNLDTFRRGVSAYSTLGWFNDPLLSSMLRYKDHDLVNTIIHETVHSTIYIKHAADFNERLAVFIGGKGMEKFYLKKEGENSSTLKQLRLENEDEKIFSSFITDELSLIEKWYRNQTERKEELRQEYFKNIQYRFSKNILPQMKTDQFVKFKDLRLNNARLLLYRTYLQDLSDFEKLWIKSHENVLEFISACRQLESSDHPEQDLKKMVQN